MKNDEIISIALLALSKIGESHSESYSAQIARNALKEIEKIKTRSTFTSNQGLGHNETVTCEIVKIENDDVYGKYISSRNVDEEDINLSIPFSLSGLILEGNNNLGKRSQPVL